MDIKSNENFYNKLWKTSRVFKPTHWGHWEVIKNLNSEKSLEIGPGTKPKISIKEGYFVDISKESLRKLEQAGGIVYQSNLQTKLPFKDSYFDLVCCFETLEHIPNDLFLLKEISRILKSTGSVLLSFPTNMDFWNDYDIRVGHYRRYNVDKLDRLFKRAGLVILEYACLQVPWPGKITGKILSFLAGKFYTLTTLLQDLADSLPNSVLTRQIKLLPWNSNNREKGNFTTIILHAKNT